MRKTLSWLGLMTLATASMGLGGCAAIAGDQTADVHFKVKPAPNGTFFYTNSLTVDLGPASVSEATLLGVTLQASDPPNTPDLTFMTSVLGQGIQSDGQLQPFCTGSAFQANQASVDTTVLFAGNIAPFFDETDTLHIQWTGTVNTAYPSFPPEGFTVDATLSVDPQ